MESISSDFLGITSQYEKQAQHQSVHDFLTEWYLNNPNDIQTNLYNEYILYLAANPYEDIRPSNPYKPVDVTTTPEDTIIRVGPLFPLPIMAFNYIIHEEVYKRIKLIIPDQQPPADEPQPPADEPQPPADQ